MLVLVWICACLGQHTPIEPPIVTLYHHHHCYRYFVHLFSSIIRWNHEANGLTICLLSFCNSQTEEVLVTLTIFSILNCHSSFVFWQLFPMLNAASIPYCYIIISFLSSPKYWLNTATVKNKLSWNLHHVAWHNECLFMFMQQDMTEAATYGTVT